MTNYINEKNKQLEMQRTRVAEQKASGRGFRFIGGQQFFSSMRDVGYGSEGQAICDIADNSIEAGATAVHVLLDKSGPRRAINSIVVADNGHGMDPDWLEASIGFGSTSRGTSREGLGRFGMGLNNAGIAFGELLEVYSHSSDSDWHRTFIDLREGSPTCFTDEYLEEVLDFRPPKAKKMAPPAWVEEKLGDFLKDSGTVVVISSLTPSRRKWTFKDFEENLKQLIGVTYNKMASDIEVFVNNEKVWFTDPLFLTPGLKGFDLDEDRAEFISEDTIEITDNETGESYGTASVSFSVLPPSFGLKPEFKKIKGTQARTDGQNTANSRFNVMREYTGVVLIRNGRVIGVDSRTYRFGNNDYNIGVELEFTGAADELFGVTSLKNKISLKKEAWDALNRIGMNRGIQGARKRRNELFKEWNPKNKVASTTDDEGNTVRPSERAASIEQKQPRKPLGRDVDEKIKQIGQTNFEQAVKKRAKETGQPEIAVRNDIMAEIVSTAFKTEVQALRNSEFVSFEPLGVQTRIIINSDHPFYKNLFGSEHTTPFGKEALNILLTSFFRALTLTHIGHTEGGKPLYDSMVSTHLLRSWSEIMGTQMVHLEEVMSPDSDDAVDNDKPSDAAADANADETEPKAS